MQEMRWQIRRVSGRSAGSDPTAERSYVPPSPRHPTATGSQSNRGAEPRVLRRSFRCRNIFVSRPLRPRSKPGPSRFLFDIEAVDHIPGTTICNTGASLLYWVAASTIKSRNVATALPPGFARPRRFDAPARVVVHYRRPQASRTISFRGCDALDRGCTRSSHRFASGWPACCQRRMNFQLSIRPRPTTAI